LPHEFIECPMLGPNHPKQITMLFIHYSNYYTILVSPFGY